MKYLLDTHILFWSIDNEEKLPSYVLDIINAPENEIYFSSASVWEVVIKHSKNPLLMPITGQYFYECCLNAGFLPLPIKIHHVLTISSLHRIAGEPVHNDPFDRVLISQAKSESMIFITHDSLLEGYSEKCVMKI